MIGGVVAIGAAFFFAGSGTAGGPEFRSADIGHGIRLHYVEQGQGPTVIFVHGSLSDYDYWQDQVGPFAARYQVIAYSRRYDFPNSNPARSGYSAVADAEDLAGLIETLHLGKVFIVGHSYGALTALFFAIEHPELVRAMVLAEPPAVSLLRRLPPEQAATGKAMFADIETRMVAPMHRAFAAGDVEGGVGAFIDYVFADARAWQTMSVAAKTQTMRDAREWEVMMTTGTLFPNLDPQALHSLRVPILLLSGGKSYPFLAMTDEELARLLPNARRVVFADSGHQMWFKHPRECRQDAEAFFAEHSGP